MDDDAKLLEAMRNLIKSKKSTLIIPAKVISIEGDNTCTVEDLNDLQIEDVRLRATIEESENNLVIKPKVGSYVLIANLVQSEEWVVISWSEVDQIEFTVDTVDFKINNDGYLIKKDGISLKSAIESLITQVKAITVPVAAAPGTSGIPVNALAFDTVQNQFNQILIN